MGFVKGFFTMLTGTWKIGSQEARREAHRSLGGRFTGG
jgi:hypothetical protein